MPLSPSSRRSALCALGVLSLAGGQVAIAAPVGITVSGAWSRPAAAGMSTGVIYLTIANTGRRPDRLLGAATPVAASAGLHQSMSMQGMSQMTAVEGGLPIPPGAVVRLAPNGYHLMLMGLKQGLKPGARFSASLDFAQAGRVPVQVQVRQTAP